MKNFLTSAMFAFSVFFANAQWTQCPLYGGRIYSLASSDTAVYAGTWGSLLNSDDSGSNWYSSDNGLPLNNFVNCIGIRGGEIYAGIDINGIYKSTNNGASWDSINVGLPSGCTPNSILFFGSEIFICMRNGLMGVYKSTDNGGTWTPVNNGITDLSVFCLVSDSTGIYAGTLNADGGVFKTTDNGLSWTSIITGFPAGVRVAAMAIKDTVIYAGIYSTGNGFQIYKSENHGANWILCSGVSSQIHNMVVCDSIIYLGTIDGVFCSTDGVVWSLINSGLTNTHITSLAENGVDVFAGTMNGLFLLSNGDTIWSPAYNGIAAYNAKVFANIGNNMLAGTDMGVFLTSDNGSTWTGKNGSIYGIRTMCADGNDVYAGDNNFLFKTSDCGDNWYSLYYETVKAVVAKGNFIIISTPSGVYRSMDYGSTWSTANSGLSSTDVRSFSISISGTLYAAVFNMGVFMSTNYGINWTYISGSFSGLTYVNCLTTIDDYIIAGLNYYNPPVITSNNYGVNWQVGSNGLFGHTVNTLKTIGNCVFSGVDDGVFFSKTNGVDWNNMSDNLPSKSVISIGRDDSCIYVGVSWNGIWKRPISDFGIDFTNHLLKDIQSKIKVFPNPANEILFIELEENATLDIINIHGQIVDSKSLTEKVNNIDISKLSSGVYTLRIRSDCGIAIRKLIKQ